MVVSEAKILLIVSATRRSFLQAWLSSTLICSYKKLPVDMKKGMQILCADGSIVLEVISADPSAGTVLARCMNNATLG